MKKYIFLSLSFLAFISYNCKEEETLTKKALERTVDSFNSYKNTLENGGYWLLIYYLEQYRVRYWVYPYQPEVFAIDKDFPKSHRGIGDYDFLIELENGEVIASSEVSYTNAEETSFFTYDIAEGPTPSFGAFSNVLHHLKFVSSTFLNTGEGETDFIVLKYKNGTFILRSHTSNSIMTLKKFAGDRETFLNKTRENSNVLQYKGLSPIDVGGTEVTLKLFPSYRQLAFVYSSNQKHVQSPFIITEKGIKLHEPVKMDRVAFDEFHFNDDKTTLVTADGSISSNFVALAITLSSNASYTTFDSNNTSDRTVNMLNRVKRAVEQPRGKSYTLLDYIRLANVMGNDQAQTAGIQSYVTEKNSLNSTSSVYYEMDFVGLANNSNEQQVEILIRDMPNEGNPVCRDSLYYYREAERLLLSLAKAGPYKVTVYNDNYAGVTSVKDLDL